MSDNSDPFNKDFFNGFETPCGAKGVLHINCPKCDASVRKRTSRVRRKKRARKS